MIKILILSLLVASCACTYGVDLSTLTSVDSFKCFLENKYTFVTPRAWHSYGGIDVNAAKTISNALEAGFK